MNDALDGRVNVIINRGEAALGLTLCARGAEIFRDIVADTAAAATRGAGEAA